MRRVGFNDKHYKAILIDYDNIVLAEPPDENLYCLTGTQVQVLLSIVQQLEWPTRYFSTIGTTVEKSKTLEFAEAIRKALLMPCNCNCNGGNYNANIQLAYDILMNDTGTVSSYAPGAPTGTFDSDPGDTTLQEQKDRAAVLCMAVDSYINTVIAEIAEQLNYNAIAGGLLIGIISWLFPVAGIIVGIAIAINLAILDLMDNDPEIIEDVKCCMLKGLTGKEPTFDNFKNALGGCNFDFGSTQAVLSAEVNRVNQNEANFRAFMVNLAMKNGTGGEGACLDCQEWMYTFDFRDDDYSEYVEFLTSESSPSAHYEAGAGYVSGFASGETVVLRVKFPVASEVVRIGWATSGFQFAASLQSIGYDGTGTTTSQSFPSWFSQTNIPQPVKFAKFFVREGVAQRVHVSGTGVSPFNIPNNITTPPF